MESEGFYKNNLKPITILYDDYISQYLSKNIYFSFMKKEGEKRDEELDKDLKNATTWKNLTARKILHVSERLRLIEQLQKDRKKEIFTEDIDIKWDNGQKKAFYPDLETYLLLTCFDMLGQSKGFRPFPDWISSKKKSVKTEREGIISKIQIEDKAQFSKELYSEYLKIYGVKKSFFNFLRELLDKETQNELLQTLSFSKGYDDIVGTEEEKDLKFSFLYDLRNGYTHSLFPPSNFPLFVKVDGQEIWRKSYDKELLISVLKKTVVMGLVEFINKKRNESN